MNKKEMTVFIVVIVVLLGLFAFFAMNKKANKENSEEPQLISINTSTIENKGGSDVENNTATLEKQEINTNKNNSKKTMQTQTITEGLTYVITKGGTGEMAKPGSTVSVHYRGTLTDGSVFDESYKRGQPFEFSLGVGQVIKGWDLGVAGMKVGEKRTLTIAPSLGYGASGVGPIPGNATLIFDIELLDVK